MLTMVLMIKSPH